MLISALITVLFFAILMLGGESSYSVFKQTTLTSCGAAIILLSLPSLLKSKLTKRGWFALGILFAALAVVCAQLVPLPAALLSGLPGREWLVADYNAAGVTPSMLTLSLSPAATFASLAALTPAIALFLVGLTAHRSEMRTLIIAYLTFVLIGVAIGLMQKALGTATPIPYVPKPASHVANGIFANRNFYAASLYSAVPLLFALTITLVNRVAKSGRIIIFGCTTVFLAIVIAALAASQSRMGMLLAMASVVLSALLLIGAFKQKEQISSARIATISMMVVLVVLGNFGLLTLLRFGELDTVDDFRLTMYRTSSDIATGLLPTGSGFGTFVPVYQLFEQPQNMLEGLFVNKAHNDWLQLVLEGGLPMAVLLVLAVIWYAIVSLRIWTHTIADEGDVYRRMATIVVALLGAHAIVDFGLRTPAIMTLFAFCLGIMAHRPLQRIKVWRADSDRSERDLRPKTHD
jgi:hypothetical protein